jgi:hypothetical protein
MNATIQGTFIFIINTNRRSERGLVLHVVVVLVPLSEFFYGIALPRLAQLGGTEGTALAHELTYKLVSQWSVQFLFLMFGDASSRKETSSLTHIMSHARPTCDSDAT